MLDSRLEMPNPTETCPPSQVPAITSASWGLVGNKGVCYKGFPFCVQIPLFPTNHPQVRLEALKIVKSFVSPGPSKWSFRKPLLEGTCGLTPVPWALKLDPLTPSRFHVLLPSTNPFSDREEVENISGNPWKSLNIMPNTTPI